MRKRIVATVLALCLVLGLVPGTAWAVEDDPLSAPAGDVQEPDGTAQDEDEDAETPEGIVPSEDTEDSDSTEPPELPDDAGLLEEETPSGEPVYDSYAEWKAAQAPDYSDKGMALFSADDVEPRVSTHIFGNQFVEVCINQNGQFTMGTREGDPNSTTDNNQNLLFGHPDPWSSETLVRIDGTDYAFQEYVTGVTVNSTGTECVATANISGVRVQQTLSLTTNPYTGIEDIISIRYTYTNTSSAARQVGIRIMLDTMLGDNDGAPFRVNSQDVKTEVEFIGNAVPQYWQSFDNLEDPRVTSTGFLYFNVGEKPDKVQFARWPDIIDSSWNYQVTDDASLTGDSAVAAYFNPRLVAGGGSGSVVTYYGISGFSEGNSDLTEPLAVRITAPTALLGSNILGGYLNNPFDVSVYMSNIGGSELADVRAVLNLSDAGGKLSVDSTQATTISVGNMTAGANETIQWSLRAIPQGVSSTAGYSISFYNGSTLLKTLNLSLRLTELNIDDLHRTVKFDLNGGEGPVPDSQRVLIGGFVSKPETPTREGYIFSGWYANPSCSGLPWFIFNLGRPVTNNITLYAKWTLNGFDKYQFDNIEKDYYYPEKSPEGYDIRHGYEISREYYDILTKDVPYSEKQTLRSILNPISGWEGACFGMSAVFMLKYADVLSPNFFQANADYLYDFDYPKDSPTIRSLMHYYYVLQDSSLFSGKIKDSEGHIGITNNKSVIDKLKNNNYPVMILIQYGQKWGYAQNYGNKHALIAYGYEDTKSEYIVNIWDPSDVTEYLTDGDEPIAYTPHANVLHISKDFSTADFGGYYDNTGTTRDSRITAVLTVEDFNGSRGNLQKELTDSGHTSGEANTAAVFYAANGTQKAFSLETNYDSFSITDGVNTAVVTDGSKTSGNLDISDASYLNEYGYAKRVSFTLPVLDGNSGYTITPAETGEQYSTTMTYDDSVDGFYANLTTKSGGTVTFSGDGTVHSEFSAPTQQTITVSRNDMITSWYSVTIDGQTTGMTVKPGTSRTSVACAEETAVTLTASDSFNSVKLNCSANADGIALYEPTSGTAEVTDSYASTIASGSFGHAVIFYSRGGTSVEAQVNIPSGGTAQKPGDPTRTGFVFGGWYASPSCADGEEWDFHTAITSDTRIYAKWLEDDSYMHAVTFRAEGYDDIIILVRNGEAITDIPAAPAGSVWDVTDFSSITSDLIVNATFGSSVEGVYTITFDANGGSVSPRSSLTANGRLATLPTPTRSNYYFAGWFTQREGGVPVTVATVFSSSATIYAHWSTDPYIPSASSDTFYISIPTFNGGSITPTTRNASPDDRVTLYAHPDAGYELDTLTVTDIRGRNIPLRSMGDNAYSFLMPAARVTVDASFVKVADNTPTTPAEDEIFTGLGTPGISGIVLNPAPMPFTDVQPQDWFYDNVDYVWKHYLMSGVTETQFSPNVTTSRAMIWTILARMNNVKANGTGSLWYEKGLLWAKERGVTDGTDPMGDITREQLATMLWRNAGRPAPGAAADLSRFSDSGTVSEYAQTAVRWAASVGILNGSDGRIDPQGTATRAQVAAMVARYGDRIA